MQALLHIELRSLVLNSATSGYLEFTQTSLCSYNYPWMSHTKKDALYGKQSQTTLFLKPPGITILWRHELMSWHSREALALQHTPTCESRLQTITGAVLHSTYDRNALGALLFLYLPLFWPHQTLLHLWNGLVRYDLIRVSLHTHIARFSDNLGWITRCVCVGEVVRKEFTGHWREGEECIVK